MHRFVYFLSLNKTFVIFHRVCSWLDGPHLWESFSGPSARHGWRSRGPECTVWGAKQGRRQLCVLVQLRGGLNPTWQPWSSGNTGESEEPDCGEEWRGSYDWLIPVTTETSGKDFQLAVWPHKHQSLMCQTLFHMDSVNPSGFYCHGW